MSKKKIIVVSLIVLLATLYGIFSSANLKPDEPYTYLENISTTLLDSNLFTHVDDLTPYTQENADMTGFTKYLENDNLIMYVNETNSSVRIKNKLTGFIWATDIVNIEQYGLTSFWRRIAQHPFKIRYIKKDNNETEFYMHEGKPDITIIKDENNNSVKFIIDLTKFKLKFSYTLILEENSIRFHLDTKDMEEYGENRFRSLDVFPFLGAAKLDEIPGYNFIPSDNGALIRYTDYALVNETYRAYFYNNDLYNGLSTSNLGLDYPVFGSVHGINQNGIFININSGAEYARYNYDPVSKFPNFHLQYVTYYLRGRHLQNVPGATQPITIYEKNVRDYDIEFTVSFLSNEEANYVGMAKAYKNYLIDEGILTKQVNLQDNIGLHLDILGSDIEEGIFFNKLQEMTNTDNILAINKELKRKDVDNIFYTLRGFNDGGMLDADYKNYTFNNDLGSYKDLRNLDVMYYYNPVVKYKTKDKPSNDTLVTIENNYARQRIMFGEYVKFYVDIDRIVKEFPKAYKKINEYGGMALDGLSNHFYSNKKHMRDEMYKIYDNLLAENIPMYDPNQIMLKRTSMYLTMPLVHERLKIFTDSVPFLPIVLSGYIPTYSSYLNFSANMNLDILKTIDYGIYPAYLITKEPSHLLSDTLSREYYGSYYGNLKDYIVSDYHFINDALKQVIGEEIVSRTVIEEGVVVTKYTNDFEIIINYKREPFEYKGIQVKPMNYIVMGS